MRRVLALLHVAARASDRDVAVPAVGLEAVRDPESGDSLPVVTVGFGF